MCAIFVFYFSSSLSFRCRLSGAITFHREISITRFWLLKISFTSSDCYVLPSLLFLCLYLIEFFLFLIFFLIGHKFNYFTKLTRLFSFVNNKMLPEKENFPNENFEHRRNIFFHGLFQNILFFFSTLLSRSFSQIFYIFFIL